MKILTSGYFKNAIHLHPMNKTELHIANMSRTNTLATSRIVR